MKPHAFIDGLIQDLTARDVYGRLSIIESGGVTILRAGVVRVAVMVDGDLLRWEISRSRGDITRANAGGMDGAAVSRAYREIGRALGI